jgi:hypothetical protein
VAQAVKFLPSKREALSSKPQYCQKKKGARCGGTYLDTSGILTLLSLRQEDLMLKISLGYIRKPYLKTRQEPGQSSNILHALSQGQEE